MLEALDRDYKRDEDWCSSDKSASSNRAAFLVQLINKHNEQKEAFLRVRSPQHLSIMTKWLMFIIIIIIIIMILFL